MQRTPFRMRVMFEFDEKLREERRREESYWHARYKRGCLFQRLGQVKKVRITPVLPPKTREIPRDGCILLSTKTCSIFILFHFTFVPRKLPPRLFDQSSIPRRGKSFSRSLLSLLIGIKGGENWSGIQGGIQGGNQLERALKTFYLIIRWVGKKGKSIRSVLSKINQRETSAGKSTIKSTGY